VKVLVVFGTRPEAIKMAPVIDALRKLEQMRTIICVSAQHRAMLDQVLEQFDIRPEHDLDLMRDGQTLPDLTSAIVGKVSRVLAREVPDLVLVHGDTTTAMASSLAAFYARIPVGHVEAGLRTGDLAQPWPEEANRRLTAVLASIHFAPTPMARDNLIREGVDANAIHVTGNTVVDALLFTLAKINGDPSMQRAIATRLPAVPPGKKLVLVTGHRRESFGEGFRNICAAIHELSRREDIEIVYPVHLNPRVREPVLRALGGVPGIHLIEPLDYVSFVSLMSKAYLVLTDSGGIQEEAPSIGKPVLVMRSTTERPEVVDAGAARLVGTDTQSIVRETNALLDNEAKYQAMIVAGNPVGDGAAGQRIAKLVKVFIEARRK